MTEVDLLITARFHHTSHTHTQALFLSPTLAHSLSPSPAPVPMSCGARCELTYLHDLLMPLNCLSHCIKMWSDVAVPKCGAIQPFCVEWFVCARVCVFETETWLTYYIHVTSQPIKPLLTGKPLSARFHISVCEISRIRQKLQQLCMQGLTRAPDSSYLNYPLPGLACLMNVLRSGNFS